MDHLTPWRKQCLNCEWCVREGVRLNLLDWSSLLVLFAFVYGFRRGVPIENSLEGVVNWIVAAGRLTNEIF